ncbi:MAG: hypothetical protein ACLT98_05095 [Eggerthellaceae bacterium]
MGLLYDASGENSLSKKRVCYIAEARTSSAAEEPVPAIIEDDEE